LRRYVHARSMQRDKLGRFLEAAKVDVVAARELATKRARIETADLVKLASLIRVVGLLLQVKAYLFWQK